MATLRQKIENAKTQFLSRKQFITGDEFLECFRSLRPQYDLQDDEILEIFDMTDENKEGKISKISIERILDTILGSEDADAVNLNISTNNRVSLYLTSAGKFSSSPSQAVQDKNLKKPKKLSSNFLNNLNIDKISEIKHIFSICDVGKGFVTMNQIRDFVGGIKQLNCTQEELIEFFSFVNDDVKNTISKENFSNVMGELEKSILNFYMGDDNEYQNRASTLVTENDYKEARLNNESILATSDVGSDSDHDDDGNFDETYNDDILQEILLIIQKVDEANDSVKNKAKSTSVISMLNEVISISSHLEKKLKHNDDKFKEMRQKLRERRNIEELLNSRIQTMEINLKHQEDALDTMQNEYDTLYNTNRGLESQLRLYDHIQSGMDEKNNEIVKLERRIKQIETQKDELQKNLGNLETEKEMLTQNFKELETLYIETEKEMEKAEAEAQAHQVAASDDAEPGSATGRPGKTVSSFEIDALRIELKTMLAKKDAIEREKNSLQEIVSELREQLATNKEFIDGLRLERNDIQSKFNKLQKELEALKSDNLKRSSIVQGSRRGSVMGENLAKAMSQQQQGHIFDSSPSNVKGGDQFDGLRGIAEEEENNEDFYDSYRGASVKPRHIEELHPRKDSDQKKEEDGSMFSHLISRKKSEEEIQTDKKSDAEIDDSKVDERQFNSLMDNRFSYIPTDKGMRFSMFEKDYAEEDDKKEEENIDANKYMTAVPVIESFAARRVTHSTAKAPIPVDIKSLSQDYLSIRNNPQIVKMLQKNKETISDNICFSDYMYRINSKEQREYRIIFVTGESLYCLHPKRYHHVIRKIPLQKIYRITISKSSAGLCAIYVHNDYDYLIDIYKRLNLVLFLQSVFRLKTLKPFSINYEQNFLVKNRGAASLKQIDQYSKAVLNPELQSTYKNAQKFGELYLKTWLVFSSWKKYFFVLTEVGLLYFKRAGSPKPIDFIPVIGYLVLDKGDAGDRKFAFKVKFPHSDFEVTLSADSEIEKKDWIRSIKKVQEAAEKQDKEKSKNDASRSLDSPEIK